MATPATTQDLVDQFEALCGMLSTRLHNNAKEEHLRLRAQQVAHRTARQFQTPVEYARAQAWAPAELAGAVVASDLGIFKTLAESACSLSVTQIAQRSKADESLVHRFVRLVVAHGMVDQVDTELYAANDITRDYANDYRASNLITMLFCSRAFAALPAFLKQTGYRNPTDVHNTAWQVAFDTKDTFWEWLRARPEEWNHFNKFMSMPRAASDDNVKLLYPLEELFEGSTAEDVLLVDVGGGLGHQCVKLRAAFPRERGRIILQDLPQVVEGRCLSDIEVMAHDMMQPQPVRGARAYYFRMICHDHSDDVNRGFLGHIRKAMNQRSRLLVHDQLVADVNPTEAVTRLDIAMMAQFGAMERSENQMRKLLESAGFKVLGQYASTSSEWKITEASLQ